MKCSHAYWSRVISECNIMSDYSVNIIKKSECVREEYIKTRFGLYQNIRIMCKTAQISSIFFLFIHRFINAYSFVRRSFLPIFIKIQKWYMQSDKPKPIHTPFSKTTMKMHACAQNHVNISIDFHFSIPYDNVCACSPFLDLRAIVIQFTCSKLS